MNLLSVTPTSKKAQALKLSVEFFHIYLGETINERHKIGLDYLKKLEKTWPFSYERIILIDDYNPKEHLISAKDVLSYLDKKIMLPDYWAYEKDLIPNAQKLLAAISNPKLKRNYEAYIKKNNKYPCSLLTASWYLTRLGKLKNDGVIKSTKKGYSYNPASRLLNLLPYDYMKVEERARKIILKSTFEKEADKIQNLYYATALDRTHDLF